MHILLCGSFDDRERNGWLQALQRAFPAAHWHLSADPFNASQIEVAVVANPPPGSLQGLPRLRLIQSLWAGVDRLMGDASLPAEVPVARMVDPAMNQAMAETALWAVLSLHRGFFRYAAQQRERLWRQWLQKRADEIQVTVLGLGQMGRTAAQRLAAQGYQVAGWTARDRATDPMIEVLSGQHALRPLLGRSDIVINLLPLTPLTEGLLDKDFFNAMKPGAALVNLARGAHVADTDLLHALDSGQLSHAVLDVVRQEPLPEDHPYWGHSQVTLLPHIAAITDMRSAAGVVAENLAALRDGKPLANLVHRGFGY